MVLVLRKKTFLILLFFKLNLQKEKYKKIYCAEKVNIISINLFMLCNRGGRNKTFLPVEHEIFRKYTINLLIIYSEFDKFVHRCKDS